MPPTPTVPKKIVLLIEQLRQACSVALGDLLALGMPPGVSTDRLLQAAVAAAEEYLVQTKASSADAASCEHAPQIALDRTRIVGCTCGWRTPFGTTDSDAAFAMHCGESA